MTALVAVVALAGCTKNENVATEDASVFVKISSGVDTKAIGDAIGTKPYVFTDGYMFFVGGGTITKRIVIGASGDFTVAQLQSGQTITVPSSSTEVYVVGNIPTTGVTMPGAGPISAVQALLISVQSQADASVTGDKVTLYGKGNIGSGSANVTVTPITARIEIAQISAGGAITSYKVAGIFVNHYYPNSKLDGTIGGSLVNNADDVAKYVGNGTAYPSTLPLYDYNASGLPAMTSLVCAPTPAGKFWYYNVMAPSDAPDAAVPHIVIRLTDVVAGGYNYPNPQFITIKAFKDGSNTALTKLTAGHAYKLLNVPFTESDLTDKPETATIDVSVSITINNWITDTVTPVL